MSDDLFGDTEQFGVLIPPKDDFPGYEGMAYAAEEDGKTVYNCHYGTAAEAV